MAFDTNQGKTHISYEVVEDFGSVCEDENYELRIRLVSWNGRPAKYDIRRWHKTDPEKCGKGLTLSGEEIEALTDALSEIKER